MSRFSYWLASAALAIASVLVGLALLVLIGVAVWLLWIEEPAEAPHRGGIESATVEPEPAPPGPAAQATEPEEEPEAIPSLSGSTRFVRRLEAGTRFEQLLEKLRWDNTERSAVEQEFRKLQPAILRADGFVSREWGVFDSLRFLTWPPRSLESLQRWPAGRLDQRAPLRIWTPTYWEYPADEREEAEALLRHLEWLTQRRVKGGVDVLATPNMGRDVFPGQGGPDWAAGVYFHRDRYCAIRTTYRPEFRRELIKHEVVHAFCRRYTARFISSRFVSEGLAEYLRLCRTDVDEIVVDPKQLRNEMAALKTALDRLRGKGDLEIDPKRLVRLSPRAFYALRPWSYRIAQAMMAYVGGGVITKALRARSDRAIVAAVERVRWGNFVDFVRAAAKGGVADEAITVEDQDSRGVDSSSESEAVFEAALRELNLWERGGTLDWLGQTNVERISAPRQRSTVADILIRRTDRPLVLLAGTSPAMDASVTVWLPGRSDNALLRGLGFGTSPHAFLESVHQGLEMHTTAVSRELEAFGREPTAINGIVPQSKYEPNEAGLARWGRHWRDENPRVVICLAASHGEASIEDPASSERAYLKALKESGVRPTAVFVFDLSAKRGQGETIARAFARLDGPQACPVAYWAPRRQ